MTIINRHITVSTVENGGDLARLKQSAKKILQNAIGKMPTPYRCATAQRALFLFDCMLRLTRKTPIANPEFFGTNDFKKMQEMFYGAMFSDRFVSYSLDKRKELSRSFNWMLNEVAKNVPVIIVPPTSTCRAFSQQLWTKRFEACNYISDEEHRLRGYYLKDKHNGMNRIQLDAIEEKIGRQFCDRLYSSLAIISRSKAKDENLKDFANTLNRFVRTRTQRYKPSDFNRGEFTQQLFVDLMRFHFEKYTRINGASKEGALGNLQKMWSRYLVTIGKLGEYGLWTLPSVLPRGNPSLSWSKNIRHRKYETLDGQITESTQKLLTTVPLQVKDSKAVELIFQQVEKDFLLVKNWAFLGIEQLRKTYQISRLLEKQSCFFNNAIVPSCHHFRPAQNKNALANTIWVIRHKHRGYVNTIDTRTTFYPKSNLDGHVPKAEVASSMALLSKNDCLLFAAYIMAVEPKLTDSALLTARAFKANTTRFTPINTDAGSVITVRKDRAKKYHDIVLCKEASDTIQLLLELTKPIREFMRSKNIVGWQNLFVYCSTPLGRPAIFPKGYSTSSAFRLYAKRQQKHLGHLADVLTLSRIRSSAGVVSYIKSLDVNEMARVLGNEPRTSLQHYLPRSFWQFLNDRRIRIFQNLLIENAVGNTKYQVIASDFSTIEDLHTFLSNFCLREPSKDETLSNAKITKSNSIKPIIGEIIVLAEANVWGVLLSVKAAVEMTKNKIHPTARHWADFAQQLVLHIESPSYTDAEIKSILVAARKHVRPEDFIGLING